CTIYGLDRFRVTEAVELEYGLRMDRYDYVAAQDLLSPRLGARVRALPRTWITGQAWQRVIGPGANEFLPPGTSGPWLPPERTFSPVSRRGTFTPERIDHVEAGAERRMPGAVLVGVRAFRQRGEDQIVTIFGLSPAGEVANTGHYHVGSAGDFEAVGWGVSASRSMGATTRASLDYSLAEAEWTGRSRDVWALANVAPQVLRRSDRVHDLTATVESVVPVSSTRVFVLYKLISAAAAPDIEPAVSRGVRFDVQINQALPFGFARSRWEALVAVKNVFHDEFDSGSIYDELMVVRAPTRVVGGVTVRF
ncbi:MAG TPA: TonB-dependent receptor, partial [Pseudolysinimonas sp.]|nr:TonB-dependent receptor [Pseudolysinimonas sp.]